MNEIPQDSLLICYQRYNLEVSSLSPSTPQIVIFNHPPPHPLLAPFALGQGKTVDTILQRYNNNSNSRKIFKLNSLLGSY